VPKSDAYDLKESELKASWFDVTTYEGLAIQLAQELDNALSTRSGVDADIRYAWKLYQQEPTRFTPPWPNAADLTSPYAREFVDALQARLMQTIFVDPVWTVEGWGDAAKRAPFVEEFHQRTMEEERLQGYLDEVIQRALVERVGTLEVSESVEWQRVNKTINAQWKTDETNAPIMGPDNQPVIVRDELGNPVEAEQGQVSAQIATDVWEPVRVGPAYDVIPYLDFLLLPGHARNRTQVWGYAKRFYRRVPELVTRVRQGIYNKDAVESLGTENEKATTQHDVPNERRVIADQRGPTAQKELWEIQFLANLDGKGERWYRATLHREKRILLRLKTDDRTTRYLRFVPFPKAGSMDGYSLVTDVMRTVLEEDTAVRNMRADKAALAIAAPILKNQTALWDEYEQPFGPRSVITVRDPNELRQMQVSDVPASINIWKNDIRADADRLVGQNDTSLGVDSGENNTLGEERLRASYVEIRVELLTKRMKEPMEELWQVRQAIWVRTLQNQQAGALPIIRKALCGMAANGIEVGSIDDGRITAEMLDGPFWGKPRGSVETADPGRQRMEWIAFLNTVPALMKWNPMIAAAMQTPQAAMAILEETLRVFRSQDKQAFIGPEAQQAMQAFIQQQQRAAQAQQMMQDPHMQMFMALAKSGGHGEQGGAPPQDGPPQLPAGAGMVQ
jgi:hypothetical protein